MGELVIFLCGVNVVDLVVVVVELVVVVVLVVVDEEVFGLDVVVAL